MRGHILQTGGRNVRSNILSVVYTLQIRQFGVEVPSHYQRRPAGALDYVRGDAFDGHRIVWGKVTPENVPAPSSRLYLKYQHVWPVQM